MIVGPFVIPDEDLSTIIRVGTNAILGNLDILPMWPVINPTIFRYPYANEPEYNDFKSYYGLQDSDPLCLYIRTVTNYPLFDLHSGEFWKSPVCKNANGVDYFEIVFTQVDIKFRSIYSTLPKPNSFGKIESSSIYAWLSSLDDPTTTNIDETVAYSHSNLYLLWRDSIIYREQSFTTTASFFTKLDEVEDKTRTAIISMFPVVTSFVLGAIVNFAFAEHPYHTELFALAIVDGYILGFVLRTYLIIIASTSALAASLLYGIFKGRIFETLLWFIGKLIMFLLFYLAYLIFQILPFLQTWFYKEYANIKKELGLDTTDILFPDHYYTDIAFILTGCFFTILFLGNLIPYSVLTSFALIMGSLGLLQLFSVFNILEVL